MDGGPSKLDALAAAAAAASTTSYVSTATEPSSSTAASGTSSRTPTPLGGAPNTNRNINNGVSSRSSSPPRTEAPNLSRAAGLNHSLRGVIPFPSSAPANSNRSLHARALPLNSSDGSSQSRGGSSHSRGGPSPTAAESFLVICDGDSVAAPPPPPAAAIATPSVAVPPTVFQKSNTKKDNKKGKNSKRTASSKSKSITITPPPAKKKRTSPKPVQPPAVPQFILSGITIGEKLSPLESTLHCGRLNNYRDTLAVEASLTSRVIQNSSQMPRAGVDSIPELNPC